jgi:hypothetical protein
VLTFGEVVQNISLGKFVRDITAPVRTSTLRKGEDRSSSVSNEAKATQDKIPHNIADIHFLISTD